MRLFFWCIIAADSTRRRAKTRRDSLGGSMTIKTNTSRVRVLCGELLAECIATFIILAIGDSAAAMYTLYDPSPYQHAYWGVCITWGLAVTLAVYVTAAVSGAHANPAVTLAQV